jgi:hypothetical protein
MRDESGFPNYCCKCLRPNPGGSWEITRGERNHLHDDVYETKYAHARVPMCAGCRWGLLSRVVVAALGAIAVAGAAFGWWYTEMKGQPVYLLAGAFGAFIIGCVAFAVLAWLVDADARVAVLSLDGAGIQFANPEYQRLYIGESRGGGRYEPEREKDPWR